MNTIIFKPNRKHFDSEEDYFRYRQECRCKVCKKIINLQEEVVIKNMELIHKECYNPFEDKAMQERGVVGDTSPALKGGE